MYPTLPLTDTLFMSYRNIRSEHYALLNNNQRKIEQLIGIITNKTKFQHSALRESIRIERESIG